MDKSLLRKQVIDFRNSMNKHEKDEKDYRIFHKLIYSEKYIKSRTVLVYVSGDIEVDTRRIINDAFKSDKTVAVPRCDTKRNEINFFIINSFDDLEKGYCSISEPKKYCKKALINDECLCIVPALAVDRYGFRLGFGKGYYDRFLSVNNVISVCLCYSGNIFDRVPTDSFDKAVDFVISD